MPAGRDGARRIRPDESAGFRAQGWGDVVDCDLSNCFGGLPHAELIKSVAWRVSGGRMLGLVMAWLEMPVEEDGGIIVEIGRRANNPFLL